jgi:hypothetical protein
MTETNKGREPVTVGQMIDAGLFTPATGSGNAPSVHITKGVWGITYPTQLDFGKRIENRVFTADAYIVDTDAEWFAATEGHWEVTDGSFPSLKLAKAYLTRLIRNNKGCGFGSGHTFRIILYKGRCYVYANSLTLNLCEKGA